MQICKYTPNEQPQITQAIRNLFLNLKIRQMKIIRPQRKQCDFKTQNRHIQNVTLKKSGEHPQKHKIIQKLSKQSIHVEKQRKIQKLHKLFLVNYLHKSNRLQIHRKIPPNLSVLQTKQQQSYLDDNGKKDYPHFSNVIKLTDLPSINNKFKFEKQMPKGIINKEEQFNVEQSCVFKIKTLYRLVTLFFKIGTEEFQPLAHKVNVSTESVKLLYDMMTDIYNLEKSLRSKKNQQTRAKSLENIKADFKKCLDKYDSQYQHSAFIPNGEHYISLKNLRNLLIDNGQSQSD